MNQVVALILVFDCTYEPFLNMLRHTDNLIVRFWFGNLIAPLSGLFFSPEDEHNLQASQQEAVDYPVVTTKYVPDQSLKVEYQRFLHSR